jgi:putative endonuclease
VARADTRTVGFDAERLATRFLKRQGLIPITKNFRCRLGEIDLIARDGDAIVFVEVRYRARSRFSRAGLTVDIHKQRKLIRTAAMFTARRSQYANSIMRFDVVAIDVDERGNKNIDWIKDAFRPTDSRL